MTALFCTKETQTDNHIQSDFELDCSFIEGTRPLLFHQCCRCNQYPEQANILHGCSQYVQPNCFGLRCPCLALKNVDNGKDDNVAEKSCAGCKDVNDNPVVFLVKEETLDDIDICGLEEEKKLKIDSAKAVAKPCSIRIRPIDKLENLFVRGRLVWKYLQGWWPAVTIRANDIGRTETNGRVWVCWVGYYQVSQVDKSKIKNFECDIEENLQKLTSYSGNYFKKERDIVCLELKKLLQIWAGLEMDEDDNDDTTKVPQAKTQLPWFENFYKRYRNKIKDVIIFPYTPNIQIGLDKTQRKFACKNMSKSTYTPNIKIGLDKTQPKIACKNVNKTINRKRNFNGELLQPNIKIGLDKTQPKIACNNVNKTINRKRNLNGELLQPNIKIGLDKTQPKIACKNVNKTIDRKRNFNGELLQNALASVLASIL